MDAQITRLEQALDNITSFWFPRCLDRQHGGYHLNYGTLGEDLGPAPKMVITQARMVWLSSRLAREGYRPDEMRSYAEHGYRFLTERMQDPKYGGYYWLVRPDGSPRRVRKHICGQSYVLYAFSEYAAASGSNEALLAADSLFNLVESRAHDHEHRGYVEAFRRNWTMPYPWQRPYLGGGASRHKTLNTHLHHMEALNAYGRLRLTDKVRERLLELIEIEMTDVYGALGDLSTLLFERDWTPVLKNPSPLCSYGHDLENIWLVTEACGVAGLSVERYLPQFLKTFEACMRLGFDYEAGGFYYEGRPGQPADRRQKVWWTQAEALTSALTMYQLTEDIQYYEVFEKTWRFVDEHIIDWDRGEWHHTIMPDGTPQGPKASEWKAGYHTGRAMLECLRLLREIREPSE